MTPSFVQMTKYGEIVDFDQETNISICFWGQNNAVVLGFVFCWWHVHRDF